MENLEEDRIVSAHQLNVELDKVRRYRNSSLEHQSKPAILLDAVETTLREQGSSIPAHPTALFAAILTTLDQLVETPETASLETLVAAALYLLAIISPFCSVPVLRAKVDLLADLLGRLLLTLLQPNENSAPALRSLLGVLQPVYLALSAKPILLENLETSQLFNTTLPLLADSRPKVRRKAHEFVWAVVFPASAAVSIPEKSKIQFHPYAKRVAEYLVTELEAGLKKARHTFGKKSETTANEAISHLLGLIAFVKGAASQWPLQVLPKLIAVVLSLPRLQHDYLTTASFDILELLYSAASKNSTASAEVVTNTLQAFIALRPPETALVILPGWIGGLETGLVALARTDPVTCRKIIVSNFEGLLGLCASSMPSEDVRSRAERAACGTIRWCLGKGDTADLEDPNSPLMRVTQITEEALKNLKWRGIGTPHLLAIVKALISRLRSRSQSSPVASTKDPRPQTLASLLLQPHVQLLGSMRVARRFEYRLDADAALGMAIEVCGPEWVSNILPLNLVPNSSNTQEGRAWLLPLMSKNTTNTCLSHFTSVLVPLSERLFTMKSQVNNEAEIKVFNLLIEQIWSTFPAFCDLPVDLPLAFTTSFVQLLMKVVEFQPSLRKVVFRGLQNLVDKNLAIVKSSAPSDELLKSFGIDQVRGRANVSTLAKLAPKLLVELFNVFLKSEKENSGSVLECISTYISILQASDVGSTYSKVCNLLESDLKQTKEKGSAVKNEEHRPAHAMLDLLTVIAPFLDRAMTLHLFQLLLSDSLLHSTDATIQKKVYRILGKLIDTPASQHVILSEISTLILKLTQEGHQVPSAAKKFRTEFMSKLVPALPSDQLHVLPTLITEAVLATKESNQYTRSASYDLILAMAEKMSHGGTIQRSLINEIDGEMATDVDASLDEFITMISAGLAGQSPFMISASILALSRLLFEYSTKLSENMINELVTTMLLYLETKTREIIRSAIGFIKVAVVALTVATLQSHLAELIPRLLTWSSDPKNHFKVKVRQIFERLIRKFGYDEIAKHVGEEDQKFINHIRKQQTARKRKANQAQAHTNEDPLTDEISKPQTLGRSAYEDVLYGSDDESDSSAEDPTEKRKSLGRKTSKKSKGRDFDSYLEEEEDEPLDLMDVDLMNRVTVHDPTQEDERRNRIKAKLKTRFDSKTGKMLLLDSDETGLKETNDFDNATNAYLEAIEGEDGHRRTVHGKTKFNKSSKRLREDEGEMNEVGDRLLSLDVGTSKAAKKRKREPTSIGSEFKAKKAGGDVKKGGISPYAFVPLASVSSGRKRVGSSKPKVSFMGRGGKRKQK